MRLRQICLVACLVLATAALRLESQAMPSVALAQYVGQYRLTDGDDVMSIYLDGGHLYAESTTYPRNELTAPTIPDDLQIGQTLYHLIFARDGQSMVSGFRAVAGGDPKVLFEAKRISKEASRPSNGPEYVRSEAIIPVRDGVKLHAVILRPKGSETGEALPFLMERTPYGVDEYTPDVVPKTKPQLAKSGYIFVYEDIRGRYKSEGQFVMNRPVVAHRAKTDVDETTDTRDTIDWLLKNVPNNDGKVGVLGISYPGFLAMMAGVDAHPAVKAISPQAPMTDVWMGDDFFHNGAFRQGYGFTYVQELEAQKTEEVVKSTEDQYNFFLHNVNFAGAAKAARMGNLPTAKMFLTQPSYTKFWQAMAVENDLAQVTVPTLEVGGWWDQEDMWGTQAEYEALRKGTDRDKVFMVLGPWNHGGWAFGPGASLGGDFGKVEFGGVKTGEEYRTKFESPFFEFYLKGKPGYELKGVASFRTGVNQWERYAEWPPVKGFNATVLRLLPDKRVDTCGSGDDCKEVLKTAVLATYVADPSDPIPYRHRPVQATYEQGSKWRTWLVEDQRFVDGRKDLAEFTGAVLDKDVTVTGDVKADLFASTTGTDADWIVKLIDVAPDGQQTMIVDEIFRGRYRASFEKPEAIPAAAVEEYKWSLHGADHTFLKGHRMMVEVQSSWFPLYDRNPQTYVENIMTAPASAYQKQTVKIYGGSRLEFESPVE